MIEESGTLPLGTLEVHRLGFGSMQLTGTGVWGPPADHDGAIRVLRRAVELGVDLIDTADSYGPDVAEELIREALHPYRPPSGSPPRPGSPVPGRASGGSAVGPSTCAQQCEGSLRRLGVDRIDLFQLHRIDPAVDPDEQFGALKELRDEGKVAEVGLSEVSVEEIEAARRIVPVVSVQNQYNIAQRGADDVLDYCERHGIGFIPWFPLASGPAGPPRRPDRPGRRGAGRHRLPGLPGLAPAPVAGDAPHPRHLVGRAPRGELRRAGHLPLRRPVRGADRGPQAVAPVGAGRLIDGGTTMSADLVIRNGTLVDGTGGPLRRADVAIEGDRIVAVGDDIARGRRELDADGLLVTPGFIDPHTHYDGQATWDPLLAPSSHHGVTTVAMGNCGVGFAPVAPDRHDWLIAMMEGVEDIPGTALHEGLRWDWESFPEYLDALDRQPRTIDVATHLPHAALRAFVMGERGADPAEHPDDDELETMAQLLARGPGRRRARGVHLAHRSPPHQHRREPGHAAGPGARADGPGLGAPRPAARACSSSCRTATARRTTNSPGRVRADRRVRPDQRAAR